MKNKAANRIVLRLLSLFMGLITVFLLIGFFREASSVLIPVLAGTLLFLAFSPLIRAFDRIKIPRYVSLVLIFVLMAGLIFLVGYVIYMAVASFSQESPVRELLSVEGEAILTRLQFYQNQFRQILLSFEGIPFLSLESLGEIQWLDVLSPIAVQISNQFLSIIGSWLVTSLVLIFVFFEAPFLKKKISRAFHTQTNNRILRMVSDIKNQVGHYLSIKLTVSALTGILVYLVLLFLGMDFPEIWGVLTFFLNFIPSFGSIFAVLIITGLSVLQFFPASPGVIDLTPLWIFLGTGTIQFVIGNLVEPRLQGNRLDISPFLVLVSLLFWGWVWGVAGMIIAVPLLAVIRIITKNVAQLKPISILMSTGRRMSPQKQSPQAQSSSLTKGPAAAQKEEQDEVSPEDHPPSG
jgi:AI-2 transport protein TqsA